MFTARHMATDGKILNLIIAWVREAYADSILTSNIAHAAGPNIPNLCDLRYT